MHIQVDLWNKNHYLDRFHDNFKYKNNISFNKDTTSKKSFPGPMLSGYSCLIEHYIHNSRSVSEYLYDESSNGMLIRQELAKPLSRALLQMVFMGNFSIAIQTLVLS
mmetsp:Transcript_56479/g.65995  ORF Transcript_56479/g.65995 Transcript_56479/m.65995 type:complete len:107 (+) Transcript_56479:126-446(+)